MKPGVVALTSIALLVAALPARGEEGVSLGPLLAPVGDETLLVHSPEVRGERTLRASLLFQYAVEPLVLVTPEQRFDRVVSRQAWVVARASFALSHRYLVALDVPAAVHASEDRAPVTERTAPSPSSFGLGDVALTARATVLGRSGGAALLGVSATLQAPTGSRSAYASDGAFRARAAAAVGGTADRFYWSTEAGALVRPDHAFAGVVPFRTGASVIAGAAAGYVVDAPRTLSVGPEALLTSAFSGEARLFDARSTALSFLLGLRYRPGEGPWVVGASGGPGIGQAPGSPDFAANLFLSWAPEKEPPPPDRDVDGTPDATDACPELPGVASSDPVMNGCPELPRDADGDAVPDSFDACPAEAGLPTGDRRTHGCPPSSDGDGDGIVDRVDACPAEPGVASEDPKRHGCAPPPRAQVVAEKIAISEQVQFETGTAVLRVDSEPLLTDVARILRDHPELEAVEVQGHTDDVGTAEYNLDLSRRRAEAVRRWLVEHGVAAERLVARGFGTSRPLAANDSEEGRARNRRVEFVITRTARAPGSKGGAP